MMKSVMQNGADRKFGGRNSFQSNGNNRMHPYDRNGSNSTFGRGNNMRGRNQNMRNDFRKGKKFL